MNSYYVGIDGGGTKTVFKMACGNEIMASCVLTSSNYHNVGIEQAQNVLKTGLDKLCEKMDITYKDIASICMGGAGVDTEEDKRVLKMAFEKLGYDNRILIVNDGLIALVAANGEQKGAIIISGTGSIGLGVKGNELIRVGGWGHIIGDEGSAYAIARDGFKAISESFDGRGKPTRLFSVIKEALKLSAPEELINYLYNPKRGKEDIASVTPLIVALYDEDEVAREIVDKNVNALVHMVKTLSERMNDQAFKLSVNGSVLIKNDCIFSLFEQSVNRFLPHVEVKRSEKESVFGALQMAKEML